MKATIEPGPVKGDIAAPPSKSMMQRVCAAALLHGGKTIINHPGYADDDKAALRVIRQLGATVSEINGSIHITSNGVDRDTGILPGADDVIDCGESGLCARLFIPIAALSDKQITITGHGSLLARPMDAFTAILPQIGVAVSSSNHRLPLTVHGPLRPGNIKVDGAVSSQFLSGLLFAFCYTPHEPGNVIEVEGLKSKPYIDMTLDVLDRFGNDVSHESYKAFYTRKSNTVTSKEIVYNIEGDWSSAAFLLVAGAIGGNITLRNLQTDSKQADKAILDVLRSAGADMVIAADHITVNCSLLQPFEFDATNCPDLFPILAILAACCDGESSIRGVHRLFYKESNRVESITEMLQDFAIHHSVEDDTLCITGEKQLQGTVIDGYNDHRIVMAAAIGALRANGPVEISCTEAVSKSYPRFFDDLVLCGGKCNFIDEQ